MATENEPKLTYKMPPVPFPIGGGSILRIESIKSIRDTRKDLVEKVAVEYDIALREGRDFQFPSDLMQSEIKFIIGLHETIGVYQREYKKNPVFRKLVNDLTPFTKDTKDMLERIQEMKSQKSK